MPQKPRRRLTRRNTPPRPTYPGAAGAAAATETATGATASAGTAAGAVASTRRTAEAARPSAYVARQTPYLRSEMRRVSIVSAVCFGMLVVLALVDRFQ